MNEKNKMRTITLLQMIIDINRVGNSELMDIHQSIRYINNNTFNKAKELIQELPNWSDRLGSDEKSIIEECVSLFEVNINDEIDYIKKELVNFKFKNLNDFEDKVIKLNKDLENYDAFSSFEYEGMDISNPYLDETGRFEVDPEKYYGKNYQEWKNSLIGLMKENNIFIFNDLPICITKYPQEDGNIEYTNYFNGMSCRGTLNEISEDLIVKDN